MEKKVDVIIQARYGASRLAGKVLLKVLDKTILEYVIERVKRAKLVGQVVVATTVKRDDSRIADLLVKAGISVYRGSEDDVLDRFYQAALLFKLDPIVRITADCPLIDPGIIDAVVMRYFESGADYCSNILEETFPDGQDVEVFSFRALEIAWKEAGLSSEREHVTPYMKKHPERFRLEGFKNAVDLSEKRWTLDEKRDFDFIKAVLKSLYHENPAFSMQDVLNFLKENPSVEKINKGIIRNEGYLKSLRQDKKAHRGMS